MFQISLSLAIVAICAIQITIISPTLSSGERTSKQAVNCSDIAHALDQCGALASYSHIIPGSAYPTTIDELKEACPRHNEGLHCFRQHMKCLKPLTKRAIMFFIESRRKHVKRLCTDVRGQAARDFTEAFNCIQKFKREKFINSEMMAIKRIDAILGEQVQEFKERFQRSCCSINAYRQSVSENMKPECDKPHLIAAVEAAIDSVVGEAIEFACPDAKSNVCHSLKDLTLLPHPSNKTLTRAGTDLMFVLTETEDSTPASNNKQPTNN